MVLGANIALFAIKCLFALACHSKSLLADGFESFANALITIIVLLSLKLATRDANESFPYGYGKVEFLASGVVNMMLMIGAFLFVGVSLSDMTEPGAERAPSLIAVVAAVISIIVNQMAFGYGRCAGEKLGSPAILANAMVNRADVWTSVTVIIAVIGANLGLTKLDHVAAILIGAIVIKMTFLGVKTAIKGLMDVSIHSEEMHIKNFAEDIGGVECVEDVKARFVGRKIWVDMKICVPSNLSLGKGLKIADSIRDVIRKKMWNVSEISVQLLPPTRGVG